ncbi:hypothetical protein PPYR_02964 [Photinus pyralis]|uniref:Malate dehydrogenase n=1 Tax=Photinus pyralis TaxID=7054 RepID=A0A5N4A1G1_PHOPY|nr:hypothetical protein PPYR_02964 [Photinus pyralis]
MICSCCRLQKHPCGRTNSLEPLKVAVTGAAGQVAYSLLYIICKGDVFGSDQPIHLHLIDTPAKVDVVNGVAMELADCNFGLLKKTVATSSLDDGFKNVSVAFLVGGSPRAAGMSRFDLLERNVPIFMEQGEALDKFARKDVKVLVVANPANTNAFICARHAPSIPVENFTALTRLDQKRAHALIAKRAGVSVSSVRNVIIWGNHSSTLVPDATHAKVELNGEMVSAAVAVKDETWLKGEFIDLVQRRGEAVISARGSSSAVSAADAAADHMRKWVMGTDPCEYVSMGVISDGSYTAPKDVVFSFPVTVRNGKWGIVNGLDLDDSYLNMIAESGEELEDEREAALSVLRGCNVNCKLMCGDDCD